MQHGNPKGELFYFSSEVTQNIAKLVNVNASICFFSRHRRYPTTNETNAPSFQVGFDIVRRKTKKDKIKFDVLSSELFAESPRSKLYSVLATLTLNPIHGTVTGNANKKRLVKIQEHHEDFPVTEAQIEFQMSALLAPYLHMSPPTFHINSNATVQSILYMKKLEGKDLFYCPQELSDTHLSQIAFDIIDGIARVHKKGYVLRDLKPENIFVNFVKAKARLIDFQTVKRVDEEDHKLVGSPEFLDPVVLDFIAKNGDVKGNLITQKSDIYAIGLTLAELLLGAINREDLEFIIAHQGNPPPKKEVEEEAGEMKTFEVPYKANFSAQVRCAIAQELLQLLNFEPEKRPSLETLKTNLIEILPSFSPPSDRETNKKKVVKTQSEADYYTQQEIIRQLQNLVVETEEPANYLDLDPLPATDEDYDNGNGDEAELIDDAGQYEGEVEGEEYDGEGYDEQYSEDENVAYDEEDENVAYSEGDGEELEDAEPEDTQDRYYDSSSNSPTFFASTAHQQENPSPLPSDKKGYHY